MVFLILLTLKKKNPLRRDVTSFAHPADGPDDGTLHEQAARECKERERCVSAAGGKAVAEKQSTERVSQLLLPRRARALWSRRRKVIVCSEK